MIHVENVNGLDFGIKFYHNIRPDVEGERPSALCEITTVPSGPTFDIREGGQVIGTGRATLHVADNYDRSTARKLTLTRAMEKAKLNKKEREEIWSEYFKHCKK